MSCHQEEKQKLRKITVLGKCYTCRHSFGCIVGRKSHDPCLRVFLLEARGMTFVAHCTYKVKLDQLVFLVLSSSTLRDCPFITLITCLR